MNVSRSYLQNNTYVSKVSAHIVKKVADKLNNLCANERETFENVWSDIRTFVEYACMRDRKFYDRVKDSLLLKLTDGKFLTTKDYLEAAKETHENTVYYTSDPAAQAQYISLFDAQNLQVAVFDHSLDSQYLSTLESYDTAVKYLRIDAGVADALKGDGETTENADLTALFRKVAGDEKMKVEYAALKDENTPLLLTVSEESRRMEEMMKLYAMNGMGSMPSFPSESTLTVNTASPLIAKLGDWNEEKKEQVAKQLYRLALLSQRKLTAEELKEFLSGSYEILNLI